MKQLAQRLRQLREDRQLSLRALGEMAGVSSSALSQIEAEQVSPPLPRSKNLHRLGAQDRRTSG
jgi:Predicted transcriptional regulator